MKSPSATFEPLMVKVLNELSDERMRTFKVTVYFLTVPSAAVTVTTRAFDPSFKFVRPAISTIASGSSDIALTET